MYIICLPISTCEKELREQKGLYLPQAAEGKLGGFALTEPGAGSDAGGLKTKAVKDGNGRMSRLLILLLLYKKRHTHIR